MNHERSENLGRWNKRSSDGAQRFALTAILTRFKAGWRPRLARVYTRVVNTPLLSRKDGSSLVGRIQLLQLVLGLFVYVLAVGGLWWTSGRVSDDFFHKQAVQWLAKLDELGTQFYVSQDRTQLSGIEKHVSGFPEIAFVRYYSATGHELLAKYNANPLDDEAVRSLSRDQFDALRELSSAEQPYLFDNPGMSGSIVRAAMPVWIKSIQSDGLLGFDLDQDQGEQRELIGFLEVGLDTSNYRSQLLKNIAVGSIVVAVLLLVLILTGRQIIKRALRPLSDLQKPLAKLARGETDIVVENSGHQEIAAIGNALNATISAIKERDDRLRQLADHDHLTGLVNRYCFTQKLGREVTRVAHEGRSSALLFIDLDYFKLVNDTLGHAAGDRLLVQVADRLKSCVLEKDTVSRFGGDEFTVLVPQVSADTAANIARSIIKILRDMHFVENGQVFNICCSVGITLIDTDRYTSDELLAQADMACYEAKSRGRSCYSLFAGRNDTDQMMAYIGWSQKIKQAIDNDHFVLYYQPIINVRTGRPELFEVLLRMPDGGKKMIEPAAFLPVAERFGLMLEIDRWVIRNALKALGELRATEGTARFCVNLSGHIFEDPHLVRRVQESLEANGLPPSSVIFEITEQVAIRYLYNASRHMQELMDMGCQFALDDFGAGFSSLTYIKRLPVDYIKIEGSFIENMANDSIDQAMVRSIVQIAQTIGKRTIAEYVHDARSLEILRELGVDYAQGFYLGRPSRTPVSPLSNGSSE